MAAGQFSCAGRGTAAGTCHGCNAAGCAGHNMTRSGGMHPPLGLLLLPGGSGSGSGAARAARHAPPAGDAAGGRCGAARAATAPGCTEIEAAPQGVCVCACARVCAWGGVDRGTRCTLQTTQWQKHTLDSLPCALLPPLSPNSQA
jgi:hypothetical protein